MTQNLRAGVARVTITPPIGTFLIGYLDREEGCRDVHDDLYATALVLDDGETRLAIVSCDLLFLHPDMVAVIRQDVESRTGIPGQNVMLAATHTHSGPSVYPLSQSDPWERAYVANLPYQIAGAIGMAQDRLQPARLGVGRGAARIGVNRRVTRPDGTVTMGEAPGKPVDTGVGVIRVDGADGRPLATLVNYACHAVAVGRTTLWVSADYPGAMRQVVEQVTGTKCLFLQGAAGDINPIGGCQETYDHARRLGTLLAGEVIRVYQDIQPVPVRVTEASADLYVTGKTLQLPLLPMMYDEGREPALEELGPQTRGMNWSQVQRLIDRRFPWALCRHSTTAPITEETVDGKVRRSVACEMQAMRLGEASLVSVAAEPFVQIGTNVKQRSARPHTFFAGYTNGCVGYIPMPAAYPEGGYEVSESFLFYRLGAPVAPECAALVAEEGLALLAALERSDCL
jgi:hypothetical protein